MASVFEPGDVAYLNGKRVMIVRRVQRSPASYRVRYEANPRGSKSVERLKGIEQVVMAVMLAKDKPKKRRSYRVNLISHEPTRFYEGKAVRIER